MAKVADKWLANPGGTTFLSEVPTGTINGVNKDLLFLRLQYLGL